MGHKSGPVKKPAEQVVKEIRRATRRQYSAEQKTRIVLSGLIGKKGITFNDRGRGLGLVHQALRYYVLSRKGMLAMVGAPMRAFVCSREGLEAPDLMLGWGCWEAPCRITKRGPKSWG